MDCPHTPRSVVQVTNSLRMDCEGVCKTLPEGSNERVGENSRFGGLGRATPRGPLGDNVS